MYLETVENNAASTVTAATSKASRAAKADGSRLSSPAPALKPVWLVAHPDDELATVLTDRPDNLDRRT